MRLANVVSTLFVLTAIAREGFGKEFKSETHQEFQEIIPCRSSNILDFKIGRRK
jgi:hypothetical protein